VWILTGGGPADRTAVLGIDIYRVAFQSFDVGLSAAIGMLLLGVSIIIGVLYVRLMRRDPIY
jgi:multiple sugar transport system permease protein